MARTEGDSRFGTQKKLQSHIVAMRNRSRALSVLFACKSGVHSGSPTAQPPHCVAAISLHIVPPGFLIRRLRFSFRSRAVRCGCSRPGRLRQRESRAGLRQPWGPGRAGSVSRSGMVLSLPEIAIVPCAGSLPFVSTDGCSRSFSSWPTPPADACRWQVLHGRGVCAAPAAGPCASGRRPRTVFRPFSWKPYLSNVHQDLCR